VEELQNKIVMENKQFTLGFTTSKKPPDYVHTTPNGSKDTLISSGHRTAVESSCQFSVSRTTGSGSSVNMSCPSARPHHAGTYTGTDNDDATTAQKTTADVIVVAGR